MTARRPGVLVLGALVAALAAAPAQSAGAAVQPLDPAFIPDCQRTGGGVAATGPSGIVFYCPTRVAVIEKSVPGAAMFFFIHELGHLAFRSGDERQADCWAAAQMADMPGGLAHLRAAVRFVRIHTRESVRYGSGKERAERLLRCYQGGLPGEP